MSQSLLPTPTAPAPSTVPETPALAQSSPTPNIAKQSKDWSDYFWLGLHFLASLRFTVFLFALSLVIVFYGTWAQVDSSLATVLSKYFRSLFVWIPLRVVFLYTVDLPGAIPFPGGWLIGGFLLANVLAAHAVRFRMRWDRSGIFLIHAGVIIMMLGEVVTGLKQVESHMTIIEGGTSNHVEVMSKVELAVINRDDDKTDDVFAIPKSRLRLDKVISHADLPFDLKLIHYMKNTAERIVDVDPKVPNLATAGIGLQKTVFERPESAGADPNQKHDIPAAHVSLLDKQTGKLVDTYLVSVLLNPQAFTVAGKRYELSLRFEHSYRPFSLTLLKAEHELHPKTKMAKKYASEVRLQNPETGEDRRLRIDMNQPLYYGGETFYQAGMESPLSDPPRDPPVSILQVVSNPGWAMPYIACFIVTLGMIIHFSLILVRFLKRGLPS